MEKPNVFFELRHAHDISHSRHAQEMRRKLEGNDRLQTQAFGRLSRAAKGTASAGVRPADPPRLLQWVRRLLTEMTKPQQNKPQPTATPTHEKATTVVHTSNTGEVLTLSK